MSTTVAAGRGFRTTVAAGTAAVGAKSGRCVDAMASRSPEASSTIEARTAWPTGVGTMPHA